MSDIDAAIIGSGVAGLSAAISLQKLGLRVIVYEKDDSFASRKQGYGMTLTNSLNGPLAALGVLDTCIKKSCPSSCHYIFNHNGDVLGYYGRELQANNSQDMLQSFHGDNTSSGVNTRPLDIDPNHGGHRGNLRIPRQELRLMLLKLLLPNTVQWGHELMEYSEMDEYCRLTLRSIKDGQEEIKQVTTLVIVGADGIRSHVRRLRDTHLGLSLRSPLTYLGVSVIIGLSTARHPLIDGRGFYVMDGTHRMFTMPYEQFQRTISADDEGCGITMWQLSFDGLSEEEAHSLRRMDESDLIAVASQRTSKWFDPVTALITSSIPGQVWATGIYDRDPLPLLPKRRGTRVTLVGDAAHPMSMFKGQGANQAIADGPLLAKWLGTGSADKGDNSVTSVTTCDDERKVAASHGMTSGTDDHASLNINKRKRIDRNSRSIESLPREALIQRALQNMAMVHTRLRCFEREMVARAGNKQKQSRDAARHLHSPAVLSDVFGLSGVRVDGVSSSELTCSRYEEILHILRSEGINARLGEKLDTSLRGAVIKHRLT